MIIFIYNYMWLKADTSHAEASQAPLNFKLFQEYFADIKISEQNNHLFSWILSLIEIAQKCFR